MNKYQNILSEINYCGLKLKNRVIYAPTTLGVSKKEYFKRIEELAKNNVSLIIIGDVPVDESKFEPNLYTKSGLKYYKTLAEIAHKYDAKIGAEVHVNDFDMKGMMKEFFKNGFKKLDETKMHELMNKVTSNYISNMKVEKIHQIIKDFGRASLILKNIGYDLIEVHGDRMCGSFTSSIFNKRSDEYGLNLDGRMKFALDSVKEIKRVLGDFPIEYKLVIRQENPHYGNAGILFEDAGIFAKKLVESGVKGFHVTLANHSNLSDTIPPKNHPYFNEEGCFLKYVDEVKKYVDVPITAVGGLIHPDFIEYELKNKRFECVAMSRELICDPMYVTKLMNDEENKIRYCVRCNKGCLMGLMHHKGAKCILK